MDKNPPSIYYIILCGPVMKVPLHAVVGFYVDITPRLSDNKIGALFIQAISCEAIQSYID
jgi:hypothetical protein